MRQVLILPVVALTTAVWGADKEPPKLEPMPKPTVLMATPRVSPPEQKEIEKANVDYIASFNRGDHKTLAGFYTEDADQADGEGNAVLTGRAAIEKELKKYFEDNHGAQLKLSVESVRSLAPGVVLENGGAVVAQAGGKSAKTHYVAVHVKRDGRWLIAHLTETAAAQAAPSPYSHLQELEWMVGSWKDNTSEADVHTTCQWATDKTFLTRSFSATSKDRGPLEGTEVLGWDPIKGNIRGWTFDSAGGFSEAIWTRDGNRWLIQSVTTLPDGRKASAHSTITHVSDDQYTWESSNRVLEGEVRPNIEKIEIDRVKAKD